MRHAGHLVRAPVRGRARSRGRRRRRGSQSKKTTRRPRRCEERSRSTLQKAHTRDSLQALSKLGELVDGQYRIVSQPPIVVPARDLAAYGRRRRPGRTRRPRAAPHLPGDPAGRSTPAAGAVRGRRLRPQGRGCRQRRHPVPSSCCCRAAISRTRCSCRSRRRPPRSCEDHAAARAGTPSTANGWSHGQRMMQAASDIFLGWTKGADRTASIYWRQLRDMKGSVEVEAMAPVGLGSTPASAGGPWRGPTPAPATRSRSPPTWARATGSTGRSPTSPQRYADQNELDYQAFAKAIRSGTARSPRRRRRSSRPIALAIGGDDRLGVHLPLVMAAWAVAPGRRW